MSTWEFLDFDVMFIKNHFKNRFFILGTVLTVASFGGCSKPPSETPAKIVELEERLNRLEMQLARLQDTLASSNDQRLKDAAKALAVNSEAKKITLKKTTSGRTYLTNGAPQTIVLKGSSSASFAFEKPSTLKTPKGDIDLRDLEVCTTPSKKGSSEADAVYPPSIDLVASPDQRFAVAIFPCAEGGENQYLVDLEKLTQITMDFSGDFFSTSSILWSPDGSYLLEEACRTFCNLTLQDTAANKVDLNMPPVFGFKNVVEAGDSEKHPDCRLAAGEWFSNSNARLKLTCSKEGGQAPASPTQGEFSMTLDLDLLNRQLSMAQ